jgi:hypothetical protein
MEAGHHDNVPHAVPAVTDYHHNLSAGQPIWVEEPENPQHQVTGNLADDACFQMADFINSINMTTNKRETFFKLELVSY